ncbi:hypothetical protein B4113_2862 [Geobacillus sp. B4113_201601]|nr:hypothetical protein B4113_2862 [Geobacillus sp. B4113_201601]
MNSLISQHFGHFHLPKMASKLSNSGDRKIKNPPDFSRKGAKCEFRDAHGKEIRVVTNVFDVSAEKMADMYQERWAVEVFFRWIKQYLNVPTLFGTTKNAVYNQLFAAFIAYVLLRWLYDRTEKRTQTTLTFISFVRRVLFGQLPLDWKSEMVAVLFEHAHFYGRSIHNFG